VRARAAQRSAQRVRMRVRVRARMPSLTHRACAWLSPCTRAQPVLQGAAACGGGGGARHGAPSLLSGHARETVEEDVLKEIDILKSLNQCARAHSAACLCCRGARCFSRQTTRAFCADARHAAAARPRPRARASARRCCASTSTSWVRRAHARAPPQRAPPPQRAHRRLDSLVCACMCVSLHPPRAFTCARVRRAGRARDKVYIVTELCAGGARARARARARPTQQQSALNE
jgi:hypothetical protein